MAKGWAINTSELDDLLKKLSKTEADLDSTARKAILAAFPIVKTAMAKEMPRSEKPRRATIKEPWRMGGHAADSTLNMLPRFRVSLRRTTVYALVGPDRLPSHATTGKAISVGGRRFYMWYVVRGHPGPGGSFVRAYPYVRKVSKAVRQQVTNAMKDVLLKELGLFD